jgi:trans-aconitate methyltransferase
MSQNWQDIWNKCSLGSGENILAQLIKTDGFDSGAGMIGLRQWQAYVSWIKEKLGVRPQDTLYEAGCGSGAFLYPFYQADHQVGGLDYSAILIDIARNVMPGMDFKHLSVALMETEPQYDIVVSNSMFQYLPTLADAEGIVESMLNKARQKIAILDIKDLQHKNIAETIRRGALPQDEYAKKYRGLAHLYFERSFFVKLAERHHCQIEIFDQHIEAYQNNQFIFNVIMEKLVL